MAPFGQRGVPAVLASFDASYEGVDLTEFTNVLELDGIRLAGRATGRNLLEWPLGRFADYRGDGEIRIDAPAGVETLTRFLTAAQIEAAEQRGRNWGPFDARPLQEAVPIGGNLVYAYGPEWIYFGEPSRHTGRVRSVQRPHGLRRPIEDRISRYECGLAGYPRRDGGEEINARIRVIRRPIADLRHAFDLDEYNLDGLLSGEFHVFGAYRGPYGFGQMAIVDGLAYGESFETAMSAVRLEDEGYGSTRCRS